MILQRLLAVGLAALSLVGPATSFAGGTTAPTARSNALLLAPNTLSMLGDSWVAQAYIDSTSAQLGLHSINLFNQANATTTLGHRINIVSDYGVSGQRSDEYLYRLPQLLASGARWAWIRGVVNDMAGAGGGFNATAAQVWNGYTNTARGNPQSAMGLKAAYDAVLASGMSLILTSEPGQVGWTAAQIAQRDIFNELQREYARTHVGVLYLDINQTILAANSVSLAFNANYSGDGTHLLTRGAWAVGQAIAATLQPYFPPVDALPDTQLEVAAGGNLIANGVFVGSSGGTAGLNVTGTVPSGYNVACDANTSAVSSVITDPNGVGNALHLVITASAAGTCNVYYALTPSSAAPGSMYRLMGRIDVLSGSSNFCGPYLSHLFQYTPSGGSLTNLQAYDMYSGATWGPGPTAAYTEIEQTPTLTIPAAYGAANQWAPTIQLPFSAAGSATVNITRLALRQVYTP